MQSRRVTQKSGNMKYGGIESDDAETSTISKHG